MKLDTNNHSVFKMNYHLIFCIKCRRKVINNKISIRLKEIFERIAINYKITLLEWESYEDYIHMFIKGEPKSELSKFINAYKSASSRLIKKEFPEIKVKLWKESFWSKSFCLLTSGENLTDAIEEYIQEKGRIY